MLFKKAKKIKQLLSNQLIVSVCNLFYIYVCSSTCTGTIIRIRDTDYGLTCYLNRDLEPNHVKSQLHKKINETKYKQTEIEEGFFTI